MTTSRFIKKLSMVTAGAALVVVGLIGGTQTGSAQVINFESDTEGPKPNGFVSASDPSGTVRFSDPLILDPTAAEPDGLFVVSPAAGAPQSTINQGLSNSDDDASPINLDFATPVTSLSFLFGNDTTPGGLAQLQTFNNGAPVGLTTVPFDGNGAADQTISFVNGAFNSASFTFVDATGTPLPLIETIDNVAFQPVPEPSSVLGLVTFGAFGAMAMLKRKSKKCNN